MHTNKLTHKYCRDHISTLSHVRSSSIALMQRCILTHAHIRTHIHPYPHPCSHNPLILTWPTEPVCTMLQAPCRDRWSPTLPPRAHVGPAIEKQKGWRVQSGHLTVDGIRQRCDFLGLTTWLEKYTFLWVVYIYCCTVIIALSSNIDLR